MQASKNQQQKQLEITPILHKNQIAQYFNKQMKLPKSFAHKIDKKLQTVEANQQNQGNGVNQLKINDIQRKIQKQINEGNLSIRSRTLQNQHQKQYQKRNISSSRSINQLNKTINDKKQKFNKQLILLNLSLNNSAYLMKQKLSQSRQSIKSTNSNYKNKRSKTYYEISDQQFNLYNQKRLKSKKKLQQLRIQKSQLRKLRQNLDKAKQNEKRQLQILQKQAQDKLIKQLKEQKITKINQRLKTLEQNRAQRVNRLKNSFIKVSSSDSLPRFKMMRYKFDYQQNLLQQKQKQKHLRQSQMKKYSNSSESIKKHSLNYSKYVNKRKQQFNNSRIQLSPQKIQKLEKQYNRPHENPERYNQSLKKNSRINQFKHVIQKKKEQMVMDPQIGLQIQIAKDKSKHPFKYHYLHTKKNLSDIQIYLNYGHFNFNSDPILMGNIYLQQVKKKRKLQQSRKSSSQKRTKTQTSADADAKTAISNRIKYPNYLAQSKRNASKRLKTSLQDHQINQLLKQHGQKSKVLQILKNKAEGHIEKSMKKIENLKNIPSYNGILSAQRQIDNEFINSIKMKLKCFKIQ